MSKDRIRFLSEQIFETGGPGKGPKFPQGFVLDASDVGQVLGADVSDDYVAGFLRRWVNRGVAEYVRSDAEVSPIDGVIVADGPLPAIVSKPFGTEKHGAPVRGIDVGNSVGDLSQLSRAELEALATERGVDVSKAKNKGEIIAALTPEGK